jgi:hypothetical protein
MTFCIKCGQPLGDGITFCPRCGYQIDGSSPELPPARIALPPRRSEYSLSAPPAGGQNPAWSAPEPVRRNSSRWMWLLAGVALLVGIIQQSNRSTPTTSSSTDSSYQPAAPTPAAEPARSPEASTSAPYQIPAPSSSRCERDSRRDGRGSRACRSHDGILGSRRHRQRVGGRAHRRLCAQNSRLCRQSLLGTFIVSPRSLSKC